MICLLDTHVFIWTCLDTGKLSPRLREIITDRENEILVSAVSFWEISLKVRMGKFSFKNLDISRLPELAGDMGFGLLPLEAGEAAGFHLLPPKKDHKDPFDRMLIWQALSRGLFLASRDRDFGLYKSEGLKVIW